MIRLPVISDHGLLQGMVSGPVARITSLLIKPASALCNLDCEYCFYVDRSSDPYRGVVERVMSPATVSRLIDGYFAYSYPASTLAFQGGEPTLAGLDFFRHVVALEQRYGRDGQHVSHSLQTNGVLLDPAWCAFLKEHEFLVGLSLDGPEDMHDRYRYNKAGRGTWRRVMAGFGHLCAADVDLSVLCVVSQANVAHAREVYRFFRELGLTSLQFIPIAEFFDDGSPRPSTVYPVEYGQFLCDLFDIWWPDRERVRIRFFDNVAEAIAGQKPSCCTLHESCDSYAVVEYNGDVYPCDFFVNEMWKLGNVTVDSWPEIARRQRRASFSAKKSVPHDDCLACEYRQICHSGCPKLRHAPKGRFEDLDWFCGAYKTTFSKIVPHLTTEISRMKAVPAAPPANSS
jgi:serine-type anaerobic sulfatase-maturating enzyme